MKSSNYNFFFPYSETHSIAYNSLTNSLALIEEPNLAAFNDFLKDGTPLPPSLSDEMKKGAFLINDYINELDVIRFNMLRNRFTSDYLGFTIAPTSDCNFRCVYCYEKDVIDAKYMSEEIQDRIIDILLDRIKLISSFSVTWYGGEPLLALDVIENLSKRFIDICNENNVNYSAGIITNGYLLTRETLEKLNDLNITFYQVTLDGPPEIHNQKRPLADGGDTYDVIINNLVESYDLLPTVSLRINIDKNNMTAGDKIYELLKAKGLLEKIIPYYGKVSNDNDCYDQAECLNNCDFSSIEYDYALRTSDASKDTVVRYPSYKSNFCGADMLWAYVIDANGWLYKCWSDIGFEDKRIGSIADEFIATNDIYFKYLLFDPTIIEPCMSCNLLPICMGGCPYRRIEGNIDNCINYRYILDRCLANAANVLSSTRDETVDKITSEEE